MAETVKLKMDYDGRPQAVIDADDRAYEARPWWEGPAIVQAKEALEACRLRAQEALEACRLVWPWVGPEKQWEFAAAVHAFEEAGKAEGEAIYRAKIDRYGSLEAWRLAECGE